MTNDPVVPIEILINTDLAKFWYLACLFPGESQAGEVWSQLERDSRGRELSVFRMHEPRSRQWFVIAISEDEQAVRDSIETMTAEGTALVLPEDLALKLVKRRARTVIESNGEQLARYGEPGVELDDHGKTRPYEPEK